MKAYWFSCLSCQQHNKQWTNTNKLRKRSNTSQLIQVSGWDACQQNNRDPSDQFFFNLSMEFKSKTHTYEIHILMFHCNHHVTTPFTHTLIHPFIFSFHVMSLQPKSIKWIIFRCFHFISCHSFHFIACHVMSFQFMHALIRESTDCILNTN